MTATKGWLASPCVSALLAVAALPALSETCDYYDAATRASMMQPCTVDFTGSGATYHMAHATFEWVEQNRQGQWAVGLLNGRPAVRYEIDRTRYSYSTLDLTLFLETSP